MTGFRNAGDIKDFYMSEKKSGGDFFQTFLDNSRPFIGAGFIVATWFICVYLFFDTLVESYGIQFPFGIGIGLRDWKFWLDRLVFNYSEDGYKWMLIPFGLINFFPILLGAFLSGLVKKWWADCIVYAVTCLIIIFFTQWVVFDPMIEKPFTSTDGQFYKDGGHELFKNFVLVPLTKEAKKKKAALKKAQIFLHTWPIAGSHAIPGYYVLGRKILSNNSLSVPELDYKLQDDEQKKILGKIEEFSLAAAVRRSLFGTQRAVCELLDAKLGEQRVSVAFNGRQILLSEERNSKYMAVFIIEKSQVKEARILPLRLERFFSPFDTKFYRPDIQDVVVISSWKKIFDWNEFKDPNKDAFKTIANKIQNLDSDGKYWGHLDKKQTYN